MDGGHAYCTFLLDRRLYGIEVGRVQEVLRSQPITPVPLADPTLRGLINLRGQIVTALDLRLRLGLPGAGEASAPMNVIVRDGADLVSLLVDEIGEVLEVDDADFEPPPETLSAAHRALLRGAYKLEGSLMLALDAARVLEIRG